MWRTCCRSYITVGTTFKISATNNDSKAHQLHKIMTNTHWDWGHAEKYKPFSHITCSSLTTTESDVDNKGRKIFYIKSFSQYAALTVLSKSQIKQSKCGRWEANRPTTACQHQQTSLRFWSTWVGSFMSTLRAFNRPRKHNMCFKLKREESGKSPERQGHMDCDVSRDIYRQYKDSRHCSNDAFVTCFFVLTWRQGWKQSGLKETMWSFSPSRLHPAFLWP